MLIVIIVQQPMVMPMQFLIPRFTNLLLLLIVRFEVSVLIQLLTSLALLQVLSAVAVAKSEWEWWRCTKVRIRGHCTVGRTGTSGTLDRY